MNTDSLVPLVKKTIAIIIALLALLIIYEIADTIYLYETTGTLIVDSPGAFLTIEQDGSKLANIGTSTSRVRLKPGAYVLIASKNRAQTSETFTIYKKQKVTENFKVTQPANPAESLPVKDANKLVNYLPFVGPNFSYEVNYIYTAKDGVEIPTIVITSPNTTDQQAALNWITAVGFNPSILNIKYLTGTPKPLASN